MTHLFFIDDQSILGDFSAIPPFISKQELSNFPPVLNVNLRSIYALN
jgi:hypothetical protein